MRRNIKIMEKRMENKINIKIKKKRCEEERNLQQRFCRKMFRAAAVLAAGVMAAGCGQQKGTTTAQKEFVYVPEYVKLDMEDSINRVQVAGDTIYYLYGHWDDATDTYQQYLGKLKTGETTPEKILLDIGEYSDLMSLDIDGEENIRAIVRTIVYDDGGNGGEAAEGGMESSAEDADDGEAQDGEPADAETGEAQDGERKETEAGEAQDADAEGADDREAQEAEHAETEAGPEDTEEGTGDGEDADGEETADTEVIGGESGSVAIISGTGNYSVSAVAVGTDSGMEYQEPAGQKMELWNIGPDGKAVEKIDLDQVFGDTDIYIQYMVCDNEGNVYLGYEQNVIVLDQTGKKLCEIDLDNWIDSMIATKSGQVLLSYWNDGVEVHTIDLAEKKVGDKIEAMQTKRYGSYTFSQGVDADILYSVDGFLYSYNFGDAEAVELLNWIDCDIDQSNISGFTMLEDGRILVITSSWDGEDDAPRVELAYLTKKKGSEVPEKKILTYGTMMIDYNLRKNIIEFNRTSQEYRIEVKEYYTDYSGEDAYTDALQLMNADIASGKCPDIIDFSSGNVQSYIAKGVVEDLYPFMDADAEINKEDYLDNVRKAYEKDGKLYAMPTSFYVSTMMAKTSDVGDKEHITLEEVMELSKELPEGAELYQYASKSSVLSSILRMNMDVFVNWNTGECRLNGDEFIQALEFANTFPKEFSWDDDAPSVPTKIREGKLILMDVSIASVQEFQMYQGMYGEPIVFIGYPTSKESGTYINSAGSLLAMSSKSPYKDGVWQFIRMGLTKEAQEKESNRNYGFPVMKSALEKMFANDMEEEYYEGPDGEKIRQPKTTWGYDDFQMEIYAATEEEIAVVRKLIESADTSYQFDMQMYNIIDEEAGAFFEGQKTAKEVADIIQSRVQIYVNENR